MSDRQESEGRLIVDGRPVIFKLITNPLIDDVVITEARILASEIENIESIAAFVTFSFVWVWSADASYSNHP
jgi:hypothetical protein